MYLGQLLGHAVGKSLIGRVRLVIKLGGCQNVPLQWRKLLEFFLKCLDNRRVGGRLVAAADPPRSCRGSDGTGSTTDGSARLNMSAITRLAIPPSQPRTKASRRLRSLRSLD